MQSTGKQLFLNITLDSPEGKHAEVATDAVESLWIIESVDQLVPVCTMIYQEAYSEFLA